MNFGEEIRKARISKGYTQANLALKSGMTQPQIARIENNDTQPRISTLIKISNALDLKLVIEFK